jgi:putative addiction module component (TIGR02574 family)
MSAATLNETLFSLPVSERLRIADELYASVPEQWIREVDQEWLAEAERRSVEMDENPDSEMSHDEFRAGIKLLSMKA